MKKISFIFSLILVALMVLPSAASAQGMPQIPQMGVDPEVRIGTLPNGLTYYIRHNEYPKGQAEFYIAQKVGSILEEDDQRGLAHFLEHMCFNGTKHFPGNSLVKYLESIGVKFGAHLNAYTAVDQTVYNISKVPTAREGAQDSCLLILHDWANDLLLEPAEIDAERAVIHEEWRSRESGQSRILEQLLPTLYPGSKYGYRMPIGTMEVVDNFAYQALRDYYEKWYRPDQQGIIVVGDIDVDRIEGKIKEMFADIEMPENPVERVYLPVDDTKGTIYAIGHDKEQRSAMAQLMIKSDVLPRELRNTMAYYVEQFCNFAVSQMLNTRLNDISSKPDAPFAAAGVYFGDYILAKTKDAMTLAVVTRSGDELPSAMGAAYRELLRASRGGFTITEFDRVKAEYLSQMETSYNNRNQRQNGTFVQQYVNNFLDGTPIPTMDETYETAKMVANMVSVDLINQQFAQSVTGDNRVLLAMMPDNADGVYPTEQQFAQALGNVDKETIEAYKEEVKAEPLIENLPKPGKIVKEQKLDKWDATEWTLSNGAKVIVKPTKFKDDEILFSATALNGTAELPSSLDNSIIFLSDALGSYGLGTYSNSDLQKYMAGKQAMLNIGFSSYNRSFSGYATPKDLPSLMELIYMGFTNINFTPDEFAAMQSSEAQMLHNQERDPQYVFGKSLREALYPNNPRLRALTPEIVNAATREQVIEIAHQMTANAADYTFTFVGNVDLEKLRPLVEQYIATIPGNAKTAQKTIKKYNPNFQQKGGKGVDTFTTPMETPQTWCYITTFGTEPYSVKNAQLADIAGQILSTRLVEIVREKEGAVYSISAQGGMDRVDPQNVEIMTAFPMKPEMKEKVLNIISDQINNLGSEINQAELDKVKEYLFKSYKERRERNAGWLTGLMGWNLNGIDTFNTAEESLKTITTDDVKNFVRDLNKQGNYRVVILDPEAK
ncbi:MAG: insulinase family protein [Firmicutes bacterium]|nr:insulinase family protein [Bacillota bacterium]MCM1400754.1 insulinase family protein [Bacteroides sp.]MCM1476827.1 insulinase family protein [Bacteroides sp.]